MKKIFTLFALAMLSIAGASAQESEVYSFEEGFKPADGQTVEATASVSVTYGVDGKWDAAKKYNFNADMKAYVSGGNNPKDGKLNENNESTGSGYSEAKKNLPLTGTYYIFAPAKSGTLEVAIILNANKPFFVTDGDGECLNSTISLTDVKGNSVTLDGSYKVAEKLYGYVEFDVEADKSYYVFCTGSKLGFGGFYFTEPTTDGISEVRSAQRDSNAYNLQGQRVSGAHKGLVISNGKKMMVK